MMDWMKAMDLGNVQKIAIVLLVAGLTTGAVAQDAVDTSGTVTAAVVVAEVADSGTSAVAAVADVTSAPAVMTFDVSATSAAVEVVPVKADEATSVSLPHGVMYQVLTEGTGAVASTTQTMYLHYTLYLTNGNKVESSRDADLPVPLQLVLGQGSFIPGAEAGVKGMRKGEIRRIFVPADQGYGNKGNDKVPPNSDLVFVMECVDVR